MKTSSSVVRGWNSVVYGRWQTLVYRRGDVVAECSGDMPLNWWRDILRRNGERRIVGRTGGGMETRVLQRCVDLRIDAMVVEARSGHGCSSEWR